MKRITIGALASLLLAAIWLPLSASAQTELKFASFVPPQYVLHEPIFEKLASDLAEATDNEVTIRIYAAGALGKGPVEQYQRAARRIAEISYGLPGYTSSIFPKTLLIELPGVTQGHEDATRKLWKVMDAHLRDEFKRTVPLAVFVTPPAVFMMRDKPVRSLADLRGLKIRVASRSAAAVIEAYGATPVPMPANKVYTSLSTGVVDGALMGSDSLLIFKLIEPTRYVTVGLPEMPTTIFMVMNEDAYHELSGEHRAALDGLTGLDISLRSAEGLARFGALALEKFAGIDGKEIVELSATARTEFDEAATGAVSKLIEALDADGLSASVVVDAMKH